jgi:hypothetical protein
VGVNAGGENVDGNLHVDRTADIGIDNFVNSEKEFKFD